MRKLILLILMLSSLFASAQTVTTISSSDSTKFRRTTGTTNAEVIIENGTRNITGGFLWNRWNGRTQFRLITPGDITGLQDSLTKKANRTFDNVASGAIAKAKADTSANGLLPKSNLFPLGDTRWANTTVVQDSLNTRVKKSGDTMTGTLNGTDIVLSGGATASSITGTSTAGSNVFVGRNSSNSNAVTFSVNTALNGGLLNINDSTATSTIELQGYDGLITTKGIQATDFMLLPNNKPIRFTAAGGDPDATIKMNTQNFLQINGTPKVYSGIGSEFIAGGGDNVAYFRQEGVSGQGAIAFRDSSGTEFAATGFSNWRNDGNFWRGRGYFEFGNAFSGEHIRYSVVRTSTPQNVQYEQIGIDTLGSISLTTKPAVWPLESTPDFKIHRTTGIHITRPIYATIDSIPTTTGLTYGLVQDQSTGQFKKQVLPTTSGFLPTSGYTGAFNAQPSSFILGSATATDANALSMRAANNNYLMRWYDAANTDLGGLYFDGTNLIANYAGGWKFSQLYAPTQAANDSSTKVATTAYVDKFNLTSGTYTPTLTNGTNVSASSAIKGHYIRVGNEVTCQVAFSYTVTSGSVGSSIDVSIPIASNFNATADLIGDGQMQGNGGNVFAFENATDDRATITFLPTAVGGSGTINVSFTYTVK